MKQIAYRVFAWGICLGVSADFFKYAAKWRGVFAWVFLRIAWAFLQIDGEER